MNLFGNRSEELGTIVVEENMPYYQSASGYRTEVTPKKKRMSRKDNYSIKELQHAELEYRKLITFVNNEASHLFDIVQDSKHGRNMDARIAHTTKSNNEMSFFNLHLQKGMVFNVPYHKMKDILGIDIDAELFTKNNRGVSVQSTIKLLKLIINKLDSIGIPRDKQHRFLYIMTFNTAKTYKDFIATYVDSDLTPDELRFAFDGRLVMHNKSPLPIEHVRDWVALPTEWVVKMISPTESTR